MAPRGTSAAEPKGATCAFCGKSQTRVAKMICGPYKGGSPVCICNECVELCAEIIAEELDSPERS